MNLPSDSADESVPICLDRPPFSIFASAAGTATAGVVAVGATDAGAVLLEVVVVVVVVVAVVANVDDTTATGVLLLETTGGDSETAAAISIFSGCEGFSKTTSLGTSLGAEVLSRPFSRLFSFCGPELGRDLTWLAG